MITQAVLVNLRESFFHAPGFWQTRFLIKTGNWCKFIDGLDKSRTDGYSILGSFVNQCDQLSTQQPGLYLFCEKRKQKHNSCERLYTLFVLEPDGSIEVLNELRTATKDWGVQLWPEIDAYFIRQQHLGEQRRKQLLQEIQQLEFELKQRRAELAALDRIEN